MSSFTVGRPPRSVARRYYLLEDSAPAGRSSGGERHVASPPDRRRALVLAPMRGPGFDQLRALLDVVYEPFIEQVPLRLYNDEQLAERVDAEGATVVICEGDRVGPETLALPLPVVGPTRG